MEGPHHPHAVFQEKLPVLTGDLEVRGNEAAGRDTAQANNDLGADQGGLCLEPVDAGLLLLRLRVPIAGRTAFDDVGDVDVLLTGQAYCCLLYTSGMIDETH